MKRRTTVYIDNELWEKFMKYLVSKHGRTHGGVISQEIEHAIEILIGKSLK